MTPGDRAALALLVAGLGTSAVLISRGHDPVSTCIRRRLVARAIAAYVAAHVCFSIPGDPLTWAGEQIARHMKRATMTEGGTMLEIDLTPMEV